MNRSVSKANESMSARLAEIQMSPHDRLRAAAYIERGEAMADALVWLTNAVKGLFKSAPARPARPASNPG